MGQHGHPLLIRLALLSLVVTALSMGSPSVFARPSTRSKSRRKSAAASFVGARF